MSVPLNLVDYCEERKEKEPFNSSQFFFLWNSQLREWAGFRDVRTMARNFLNDWWIQGNSILYSRKFLFKYLWWNSLYRNPYKNIKFWHVSFKFYLHLTLLFHTKDYLSLKKEIGLVWVCRSSAVVVFASSLL